MRGKPKSMDEDVGKKDMSKEECSDQEAKEPLKTKPITINPAWIRFWELIYKMHAEIVDRDSQEAAQKAAEVSGGTANA